MKRKTIKIGSKKNSGVDAPSTASPHFGELPKAGASNPTLWADVIVWGLNNEAGLLLLRFFHTLPDVAVEVARIQLPQGLAIETLASITQHLIGQQAPPTQSLPIKQSKEKAASRRRNG